MPAVGMRRSFKSATVTPFRSATPGQKTKPTSRMAGKIRTAVFSGLCRARAFGIISPITTWK